MSKDIWDNDPRNPEYESGDEISPCLNCTNETSDDFCCDFCKDEYFE